MNHAELLAELQKRKALIVHCSMAGTGDDNSDEPLYPDDLRNAISICDDGETLSCSVVWPDHLETFGSVGIILKSRSTASFTSVCAHDSGSYIDQKSKEHMPGGGLFSSKAVSDTFASPKGHNEWTVKDADTIGIFVNPTGPIAISSWIMPDKIRCSGLGRTTNIEPFIDSVWISLSSVASSFQDLPLYSYRYNEIVRIEFDGKNSTCVVVDPADLYC